MMVSYIY
ncbi:hypothetical protein F383_14390 [Gossypium arboreum]|nr:hypothetical protein F383_14390 [Gossypium arboreum]